MAGSSLTCRTVRAWLLATALCAAIAVSACGSMVGEKGSTGSGSGARGEGGAPPGASEVVSETVPATQTLPPGPPPEGAGRVVPAVTSAPIPESENLPVVNVELKNGSISIDQNSLTIGVPYRFVVTNRGKQDHTLELRTASYGAKPPTPVFTLEGRPLKPGESRVLLVSFTFPGPYQLVCPLEGHRDSGEIASLGVL